LFFVFLLAVSVFSICQFAGLVACGVISEESLDDIPPWVSIIAFLGSWALPVALVAGAGLPFFIDSKHVLYGVAAVGLVTIPLPLFFVALSAAFLVRPRRESKGHPITERRSD